MSPSNPGISSTGNSRDPRIFPLTLAAGFLFLALLGSWKEQRMLTIGAAFFAALAVIAALLFPARLVALERAWMRLGEAIGSVTTPILLTVVYYIVLAPIGLARRATTKRDKATESYWHPRPPLPPSSRMERQF